MNQNWRVISARTAARALGFAFIIGSPFLLLFCIEQSLSLVHNQIASDYFDNERETLARNAILPVKFLLNPSEFAEELRGTKTKVAVFGESSAAGYASPMGFADFLERGLSEHLVVHNFAEPGAPFAGTQSDLAKLLMPLYDVIIIYAGHNEIWSKLNRKTREQNAIVSFPWGGWVDHRPGDLRHSLKMMSLQKFLANNSFEKKFGFADRVRAEVWGLAYEISLNSRLVNLIKSLSKNLTQLKSLASKPEESIQRLPFYVPDPFIDADDKKEMVSSYAESIKEIAAKLRPNQTLVLSTNISNDLFPPLLDVAKGIEVTDAQVNVQRYYQSIANGQLNFSEEEAEALPGTAHKMYLKSALCLEGISPTQTSRKPPESCLDLALVARAHDTFPNRVQPGVNDFIRSMMFKMPNVRVVDPEMAIRKSASQSNYFDFFVDFIHPSAVGHMLIANLLVHELDLPIRAFFPQMGECDTFIADGEQAQKILVPDPKMFKLQLRNNIAWNENFAMKSSTPWLYQYYKNRAELKMKKCTINN